MDPIFLQRLIFCIVTKYGVPFVDDEDEFRPRLYMHRRDGIGECHFAEPIDRRPFFAYLVSHSHGQALDKSLLILTELKKTLHV